MKKLVFFLFCYWVSVPLFAQVVNVADASFDIGKKTDKIFYYGFAAGDRVVFHVESEKQKAIDALEFYTYNSDQAMFSLLKFKSIDTKEILIPTTGIYCFKFTNRTRRVRVCHLKIERNPASLAFSDFNTTVYWKNVQDTLSNSLPEQVIVRRDTSAVTLIDRVSRIAAKHSLSSRQNTEQVSFYLPKGTVAWSYFIGSGSEGENSYKSATSKFVSSLAGAASHFPGYGTMAALALYGVNFFLQPQGSDELQFWFIGDQQNMNAFNQGKYFRSIKEGKVITDAAQMKYPLNGKVFLAVRNNNQIESVPTIIKVAAVVVQNHEIGNSIKQNTYVERKIPYLRN